MTRGLWAAGLGLASLTALLLLLGMYYQFDMRWKHFGTTDWMAYWSTARGAVLGHGFYDQEWLQSTQRAVGYNRTYIGPHYYPVFTLWNPPPFLIPLLPLSALPFTLSTLLWLGSSVLLVSAAALCWNRALGLPIPDAASLMLAFTLIPLVNALYFGQVGPVLGALIIFAWLAQRRGHSVAAGVLLALQLLKPHLLFVAVLLILLVALQRREWATPITFGVFAASWVGATFLLDPGWLMGWFEQGTPTAWQTLSLLDMAKTGFGLPAWFRFVGLPIGALVALWRYSRLRAAEPQHLGEAACWSVLLSPYIWNHDVSVLLPAMLWIAAVLWHRKLGKGLLVILAGLILWGLRPPQLVLPFLAFLLAFLVLWGAALRLGLSDTSVNIVAERADIGAAT